MRSVFRIVKELHRATAVDGEGAARYGGRWNSRETRVVYTSESRALAALETLVHIDRSIPFGWVLLRCDLPEALIRELPGPDLPADWRSEPATAATREIGDRWVQEGRSAVLRVPSILIPEEANYLLNPAHRDFRRIRFATPVPFAFDPQAFRGKAR